MYVLLNRNNILVDILYQANYIKNQPSNGLVIGCDESQGTGIIGSDSNTHYVLIKSDMTNSLDAVTVKEVESVDTNVKPHLYKWDDETNSLVYRYSLEEAKNLKQQENKAIFSKYLEDNPLVWKDGKEYGITQEDQMEINLNLDQYQSNAMIDSDETLTLEWHAKGEASTTWQSSDLRELNLTIQEKVRPIFHKMQEYKTQILNSTSIEELEQINLIY